ncbi:MAG: YceI family protein [Sphingomonadales bacterium]|nr:YceI family protein [Sphingomonadales bacterium]
MRPVLAAAALFALVPPALAQGVPGNPDPAAAHAGSYVVEPNHTRVQFTVSHMGFTEWYGDFTGVSGTLALDPAHPAASRVAVTIPVASVSTTNARLDEELKSAPWFDVASWPEIRFVSTAITPTGPNSARITGALTFHGVTRPVVLQASFMGGGVNPLSKAYTVGFNASTTIRRSDFGMKTYVPMIGDEVAIRISAAFEAH